MLKGTIHQQDITIINIYAPNNGAATFIKQILLKFKNQIDHNTIIMGDFNTPLSPLDRSSKQKLNKETIDLNITINNLDLTDIYRIYQPSSSGYTFFSDYMSNSRRQSICPSVDEWIKKMWYTYTMEYYSAIKENKIIEFVDKWMELENIMLSEVSQSPQKTNAECFL
uniref:Endonuclease/exonuclease/phosphatase domain-containing protein n=1 Tax=Spermophilus dauricus TaxID=99837 RepID=A0A8C9QWM7_SPEDA